MGRHLREGRSREDVPLSEKRGDERDTRKCEEVSSITENGTSANCATFTEKDLSAKRGEEKRAETRTQYLRDDTIGRNQRPHAESMEMGLYD